MTGALPLRPQSRAGSPLTIPGFRGGGAGRQNAGQGGQDARAPPERAIRNDHLGRLSFLRDRPVAATALRDLAYRVESAPPQEEESGCVVVCWNWGSVLKPVIAPTPIPPAPAAPSGVEGGGAATGARPCCSSFISAILAGLVK